MWNQGSVFPLLIVTSGGKFTGLFVYSGNAPAHGNLVASITSQAGTDPYGNHFDPGITSYDNTFGGVSNLNGAVLEIFSGLNLLEILNPAGLFIYTPNAAAGKLIAAIAPSPGTDGFGNAFPQGISSIAAGAAESTLISGTLQLRTLGTNASASPATVTIGSTAAGQQIALGSGTGPEAGAAPSDIRLNDSGLGLPALLVDDARDGQTYVAGHLTRFATTDQSITSTTFATVCDTAPTVGVGTYRVRAVMSCQQGPNVVADDYRLGFTGTISQVRVNAEFVSKTAGGQLVFASDTTSNNGLLATPAYAANAFYTAIFDGIIVTTSSGTLSMQAAMSGAGNTFTVLALSFFHLEPVS